MAGKPLAAAGLLFVLTSQMLSGLGFRVPNQDPEAIARGNAFVATADNPSALYYNPAGITQLPGQNIQLGALNYLGLTSRYRSPTGQRTETDFEVVPLPHLYFTCAPEKLPVSFGLGLYAPFGLGLEWPETSGFRTLAIEGRMAYLTLNPVVAWRVAETLSVAAGPTFNYSDLKLRSGVLSPWPGGDEVLFKGDGFGYGFTTGLLWQPHRQWALGVNYRSFSTLDYRGHTAVTSPFLPSGRLPASARFEFPQIVCAGISYRPTPRWNIEADVDWTDWDTLNTVMLSQSTIGPLPLALNWRASWFYQIGGTYRLDRGYSVGFGYFFSGNSTSERDFNPIVPDTDLHVGSLGVSFRGRHWRWGLAAQIITGPERAVRTSKVSAGGQNPNGSYQWIVPALTASVGYHF